MEVDDEEVDAERREDGKKQHARSRVPALYPFLPRENGIIRRATHTVIVLPASLSSSAVKVAKRMKRYGRY